jgi:hypothetical protein
MSAAAVLAGHTVALLVGSVAIIGLALRLRRLERWRATLDASAARALANLDAAPRGWDWRKRLALMAEVNAAFDAGAPATAASSAEPLPPEPRP